MRCQASRSCSSSSGGRSDGSSGVSSSAGGCPVPPRPPPGVRFADRRLQRLLQLLDPVRERLALQVPLRPRHLDKRELQRQPGVGALAHVVDGYGEKVDETEHRRLRELVRLLAEALARLLGDRQRVRHVAHVLDEQQVAKVLEEVGDEASEILPLLGQLLHEYERAGGVAVDDRVAEPEQRVLLDRAEKLQHRLDGDPALGRCRELVERRDRVPERASRAARDKGQRRVRRLDPLALAHAPQHADELGQSRPLEDERLAARPDRR